MKTKTNNIEVMSPAGSYEALHAAIKAGANSVYFGVTQLNMRSRSSKNFTLEDLKKIAKICSDNDVKSYLTLNTVMYEHDMTLMKKICDTAKKSGVTALIISDRRPSLKSKKAEMLIVNRVFMKIKIGKYNIL